MLVSLRAGRRYGSAALQANAVHFASDLAGSVAVLGGLLGVRAGWKEADSAAALFVALLVLAAAARLMRRNVDVLMDRVPSEAQEIASRAIRSLEPPVQLRRLRMRQAGSKQFADVVIGVPPGAAVSVQTHLEPLAEPARGKTVERDAGFVEEIVRATTGAAPRELRFLDTDDGLVAFVTLGLDPGTTLADAHRRASEVEERIRRERPEIAEVIVHTEP